MQKGGTHLKKVFVSVRNRLLSEAIFRALSDYGEFYPCSLPAEVRVGNAEDDATSDKDIYLMEVSYIPGTTVEARLEEIRQVKSSNPECKIAVLCDDNAAPELAYKVTRLKKDHLIDSFFYTSGTANYLMATLAAL